MWLHLLLYVSKTKHNICYVYPNILKELLFNNILKSLKFSIFQTQILIVIVDIWSITVVLNVFYMSLSFANVIVIKLIDYFDNS